MFIYGFLYVLSNIFLYSFFTQKNVLTVSGPANPENAKNIQRYIKNVVHPKFNSVPTGKT